jgi:hypothetical protein
VNSANCRRETTRPGMRGSDRQLVTALVTTGLQNGAAGTGAHTGTETVRLGSLTLIWLVGTLHKNLFSNSF